MLCFLIVVYLALFLDNSIVRIRLFSADSMNYIDVARNISNAKGIVQSTLGFNQALLFNQDSSIPAPFTSQPPLFPILIAIISRVGLDQANAALLISASAFGYVTLLAYFIMRKLYGPPVAVLSAGLLLVYPDLRLVARYAWTETLGISFVLTTLYCAIRLADEHQTARNAILWAAVAGLSAGLAFDARYVFGTAAIIGLVYLVLYLRADKQMLLTGGIAYLAGLSVPVGLELRHNWVVAGRILPVLLPSDRGLVLNIEDAAFRLFADNVWSGLSGLDLNRLVRLGLNLIVLVLVLGLLLKNLRSPNVLSDTFFSNGRSLLLVWFFAYLIVLIVQRSLQSFDTIGERLIVPAGIVVPLLLAVLYTQSVGPPVAENNILVSVAMVLLVALLEVGVGLTWPAVSDGTTIAQSPRLTWIEQNTSPHDLVVGDDAVDIPFYFRQDAASFSPYPFTVHLQYDQLVGFVGNQCANYRRFYLVLRDYRLEPDQIQYQFGDFITNVLAGHLKDYPDITDIGRLPDAYLYRILTCDLRGSKP